MCANGVVLCRLLAMGQDPLQAISRARLHHQLLPDRVRAEYWNVTNTTGPSFMVAAAEVAVCCMSLLCIQVEAIAMLLLD